MSRKAELLLSYRDNRENGLLEEFRIWRIQRSHRYLFGLKYRLALVDPKARFLILLCDNHWPKGPHIHRGSKEESYVFLGIDTLFQDFFRESRIEEKRYFEDQKNSD